MQAVPHTLKAFDDDLDRLRALVCELGGRAEAAVADAVAALVQRRSPTGPDSARRPGPVDALVARIEREAVQMIALRSPLADDLREVLSAFKIVALIARMADNAANIARRALSSASSAREQMRTIATMGEAVGDGQGGARCLCGARSRGGGAGDRDGRRGRRASMPACSRRWSI